MTQVDPLNLVGYTSAMSPYTVDDTPPFCQTVSRRLTLLLRETYKRRTGKGNSPSSGNRMS